MCCQQRMRWLPLLQEIKLVSQASNRESFTWKNLIQRKNKSNLLSAIHHPKIEISSLFWGQYCKHLLCYRSGHPLVFTQKSLGHLVSDLVKRKKKPVLVVFLTFSDKMVSKRWLPKVTNCFQWYRAFNLNSAFQFAKYFRSSIKSKQMRPREQLSY